MSNSLYFSATFHRLHFKRYSHWPNAGLEWDAPVDAFSVGCVLAELACGHPLFTASFDTAERIAAIEVVIGFFPSVTVQAARKHNKGLFTRDWPARVKFPPDSLKEEDMANSEAMARIASLSHFSVRRT